MLNKPGRQAFVVTALLLIALAAASCGNGQSATTQGASSTSPISATTEALESTTSLSSVPAENTTEQSASATTAPGTSAASSASFRPGEWTRQSPVGDQPPARTLQSFVYAPSIDRILMFGGTLLDSNGDLLDDANDLWSYDPRTAIWRQVQPTSPAPPAEYGFTTGFDEKSGRLILFFGDISSSGLSDTWSYDPATNAWSQLKPENPPPDGMESCKMVYDPDGERTLLLAPWVRSDDYVEVWAYDPVKNAWAQLEPVGPAPKARKATPVVYDTELRRLVMIGGTDDNGAVGEVWLFDPTSRKWQKQTDLADQGLGRVALGTPMTAACDPKGKRILLSTTGLDKSGTQVFKTFSYDPSADKWTDLTPSESEAAPPTMLKVASFVHDTGLGAFILMGGVTGTDLYTPNGDAWIYVPSQGQ
jgi:hypothetical protein